MAKVIYAYFMLTLCFISCSSIKRKDNSTLKPYADWKTVVNLEIEKEQNLYPNCAYMGDRCKEQIKLTNLENNKKILDSLRIVSHSIHSFIIIDKYFQGFEYQHSSKFLVSDKLKKRVKGVLYTWYDPNPMDTDTSIPIIDKNIAYKYNHIKKHFKLGHEDGCYPDCIYIITILDRNFNIQKCVVNISPYDYL